MSDAANTSACAPLEAKMAEKPRGLCGFNLTAQIMLHPDVYDEMLRQNGGVAAHGFVRGEAIALKP